jgi:hypothetical protein
LRAIESILRGLLDPEAEGITILEMSGIIGGSARCNIPEECNVQEHRCDLVQYHCCLGK